ncbi:tripartite tricarboxylate transporter TctB family protein [Roseomonas elaeocarpi]|uniref:Tripartite tricarboxylate transporter TctB family protein n=1 Tax=Roseomonas elaeocarpi TaxID=907779 RepID=A0ABV6JNS2_9PROT
MLLTGILTSSRFKDYTSGSILIVLGLAAAYQAQSYRIGTFTRMGPGFFPVCLGLILALTGLVLISSNFVRNARHGRPATAAAQHPPEWRGWICISVSVLAFAFLAKLTGLVPATFTCVFVAALGDRENSLLAALSLAAAITVAGVVIFWWGLGIPFSLFSQGTI